MFPVPGSLCSTLLFVGVFVFVSADQKTMTAESGQDVTLTCRAPNNNKGAVKWSKVDHKEEYVVLYRDGHFVPDNQHPSFKNWVDLQDRQMKDGDMSLILKNVTINDTGTYECRVVQGVRQPMKLINSTNLHVVPPGQTGGDTEDGGKDEGEKEEEEEEVSVGLIIILCISAVVLVTAVVGCLIYRNYKQRQCQDLFQPSSEMQQL